MFNYLVFVGAEEGRLCDQICGDVRARPASGEPQLRHPGLQPLGLPKTARVDRVVRVPIE
eukprot:3418481-Pyramimonas_sp.AAC.1